jgi:hypothetical protein
MSISFQVAAQANADAGRDAKKIIDGSSNREPAGSAAGGHQRRLTNLLS